MKKDVVVDDPAEFHRYWDPIKKAFNTAGTSKSKHGEEDIIDDTKTNISHGGILSIAQ
tara:strand:- start:621 stop:794 length:174 start_codon:yes stop_codon:yes gene_type:complete